MGSIPQDRERLDERDKFLSDAKPRPMRSERPPEERGERGPRSPKVNKKMRLGTSNAN